jgi:hypothetical protein
MTRRNVEHKIQINKLNPQAVRISLGVLRKL